MKKIKDLNKITRAERIAFWNNFIAKLNSGEIKQVTGQWEDGEDKACVMGVGRKALREMTGKSNVTDGEVVTALGAATSKIAKIYNSSLPEDEQLSIAVPDGGSGAFINLNDHEGVKFSQFAEILKSAKCEIINKKHPKKKAVKKAKAKT